MIPKLFLQCKENELWNDYHEQSLFINQYGRKCFNVVLQLEPCNNMSIVMSDIMSYGFV